MGLRNYHMLPRGYLVTKKHEGHMVIKVPFISMAICLLLSNVLLCM